ncbi:MAG: hypothetical protein R6U70_06590 [Bacillota bacterium]
MSKTLLSWVMSFLVISLCGCANVSAEEQQTDITPETDIRDLVEDFGSRLRLVPSLAPSDVISRSMEENYGNLVTGDLLESWQHSPEDAPTRRLSSPWPDRIEISTVQQLTDDEYEVEGQIIEITSVEKESGGAAAKRPITLSVNREGDRWLISDVVLGEYESVIVYRNTDYGFSLSLPESWGGYSIVSEEWTGTALEASQAGESIEHGPLLSIRHPAWTEENVRQDIPIMVFTTAQWEALQDGEFSVSAAPVGPSELDRNDEYVFALPPRYNYAFPEGCEEVEEILGSEPLRAINLLSE